MDLGNFSVSLNVKDIKASKEFYEALGFTVFHGNVEQKWMVLKNKTATVGLFQDMIDKNMLTFNPGWDKNAVSVSKFTDIRKIQEQFKKNGLLDANQVAPDSTGPANFMVIDPDGNPILIDQHV